MISVPTMFSPIAIVDFALVIRLLGTFQERLGQVNCVVEIVVVHVAAVDVDLAF